MSTMAQLQDLLDLEDATEHEVAEVLQARLSFSLKSDPPQQCDSSTPAVGDGCSGYAGAGSMY